MNVFAEKKHQIPRMSDYSVPIFLNGCDIFSQKHIFPLLLCTFSSHFWYIFFVSFI